VEIKDIAKGHNNWCLLHLGEKEKRKQLTEWIKIKTLQ
jgi:hypothetical protein